MSSRSHDIVDLKEKLALLLRHKASGIATQTELANKSGIDNSVINRWLNPTKVGLRDFEKLSEVHKELVSEELWHKPIEEFAKALDFPYDSLKEVTPNPSVLTERFGIDFESRIKDRNLLEKRFEIMKGYWEIFFYSASETSGKYIVFNILEFNKLNENGYIECYASHGNFNYRGYCFFVGSVTCFAMEEISLLNEIVFLSTNTPVRTTDPRLNGILLLLTNDTSELISIPTATKVVLRHIGSIEKVKEKYKLTSTEKKDLQQLIQEVRTAINLDNSQISDIIPLIDNHIPQDANPYTLRVKLF